ncbi:unnamed protein product [Microthlaspi erraticum]|uniref:Calcium-transporting ATPase n=1 Tax=Microthlaspi erraticum TaxID=1685480 RepID=A0A6D2KPT7_9BRAS|nr:unnamed protein product [Microthlaspi erraticum]
MYRLWRSLSISGAAKDVEVGLGGSCGSASAAHDGDATVPHDLETGIIGGDYVAAADDRRSSWWVRAISSTWRMMSTGSRASSDQVSEAEAANVVPATTSTSGGFAIGFNELSQVVRDRNLQYLNHNNGVRELSTRLKTDLEKGIDRRDDEILQRREAFGSNIYPCQSGKRFWSFIWKASQFPPSLFMMLATVINSLLRIKKKAIHDGWYVEACIILATVLDIIVRAITEYRQSCQSAKFREEKRYVRVEVIRGGRRVSVFTYDVVVGDIVPLKNGYQVPADGVLFVENSLKIDEQEITGSHGYVRKNLLKDPFLLSGSKVIEGIGTMLVTSVGINTKLGSKMETPHESDEEKPFQVYLRWLANSASCLVVSFASIACIVQLCRYSYGQSRNSDEATEFVIKSLSFGNATVFVALPVGLSVAVLLNVADTTKKMKTDNALVQTLSSCETMGSFLLPLYLPEYPFKHSFSAKQMSVVDVCAGGIRMQDMDDVSQLPPLLKELLIEGIAQNTNGSVVFETGVVEPEVYGSQTEQAILIWGNKLGMKFEDARSASVVHHTIPFNPNKKYGGVELKLGTRSHVHWKGSAKVILSSCVSYVDGADNLRDIDDQQRKVFEERIENMCKGRMRCAALAYRRYEPESLPTIEELSRLPQNLVLLAIIGIKDPCRPGTRDAIQLCNSAGVKVCMVTDDDVLTAQAIAMDCGILEVTLGIDDVRTGAQFRELSDEERDQIAENILVLAQATPSDNLLLVKALKKTGHVVAATGMGIHDTMTLREADVGLAMGIGGTAAAKESSDIIILDDSFVTILKVIQWCRSLYTNIQRYVLFRLTVTVSTVAICVVEVVVYDAFPLFAVQLLLLNLIVDIFGALALAYRPTPQHLMGKPPVGIRDDLITTTMWCKLVIQVIYLVLILALINSDTLLKLKHGNTGDAEKVKNTFIFNSLVFCLVFGEFEIRSGDQTLKEILRDNMFLITIGSTILFQIIVTQFLGIFISGVRLDFKNWVLAILVGLVSQAATHFPLQAFQYLQNVILALALTVPFFGYILSLTGSLVSVTIAVILPSAFYLKICWDGMSKFKRVANLGCVLGVLGSFDSSKSLVKELVRVHGANPPLGPPPVSAGDLETRPEENREGSGDLDIPVAMHVRRWC